MVITIIAKSINSTLRHILTSSPIPAFLAHLGLVSIQTRYNINPQSGMKKPNIAQPKLPLSSTPGWTLGWLT